MPIEWSVPKVKLASAGLVLPVCIAYMLFAALWIEISDHLLVSVTRDTPTYAELQTYKGWLFVAVTSTLLFLLLWRAVLRSHIEMRRLASHDSLTGLPTRQSFEIEINRIENDVQMGSPAALLLLDIDNFSLLNETIGYGRANQVLREIAEHLRDFPLPIAALCRWSGDEFGILLENTPLEQARIYADELVQGIGSISLNGSIHLTASVGVADVCGNDETQTFTASSAALSAAKGKGGNRAVVHQTDQPHTRRLEESRHWYAWFQSERLEERLTLHFQPVVALGSGRVEYHEVLLRIRNDDGSTALPGSFIPTAERLGLMPRIDRWVLSEVFELLSSRLDAKLFVNVSATSLTDDSLLPYIEDRMHRVRGSAGRLTLEVTETADITDRNRVNQWMARLRDSGCQFALDDFGTGFSTFSYLKSIPADWVKIDGSFIRDIETDTANRALVRAVKNAAEALGKKVIAEWVESERSARYLRNMGIEYGQGYLWGTPSPDLLLTPFTSRSSYASFFSSSL